MRARIVYWLDSVTLWLDNHSAKWSVEMGKSVSKDVQERRERIQRYRRRY